MTVTANDLNFMRLQSDSATTLTVFAAQQTTVSGVTVTEGWRQTTLTLTSDEQSQIAAIIARAKTAIAAQ